MYSCSIFFINVFGFVKDKIENFETVDALKTDIKTRLDEQAKQAADQEERADVLKQVVDDVKVEIPEGMVRSECDRQLRYFEQTLMQSGINLKQYMEMANKTLDQMREDVKEQAESSLKTQLVLKGIITIEDWAKIGSHIQYDYLKDGYFAELKEAEILRERLSLAQEVSQYVGKYYSVEYIRKKVLRQSDEDIIEIDNQIANEIKQGIIAAPEGQDMDTEMQDTGINIGDE